MTNARRALLVGLTEEQKNPEEVRKGLDVLEDAYKCPMEILVRIEELYSKENNLNNQKKVIKEMETITDQYDEAVDRATSQLPAVKPTLSSMECESIKRRNPVKSEFISQLQYPTSMTQGPSMTFPSGPWQQLKKYRFQCLMEIKSSTSPGRRHSWHVETVLHNQQSTNFCK